MRFTPYDELGERPHIIVDGAPTAHTSLTLSHWPGSTTPQPLKDDLSAQIVFHYLERPEFQIDAELVSNNHFDEDGLVGVYSLINPNESLKQKALLIDVAAAGDFGTYRLREAARIAFVLAAFADPDLSPLEPGTFRGPYPRMSARLYEAMLPRLPEILNNVEGFRAYWEAEDAALDQSETMIQNGRIQIEETPELDLAIVTLPAGVSRHSMAVHNAIRSFRVLRIQGASYEFQYRYESWVQYMTRRPLPRIDLAPLAAELSDQESGNGRWVFDGVEGITPAMRLVDAAESRIPRQEFVNRLIAFLRDANHQGT